MSRGQVHAGTWVTAAHPLEALCESSHGANTPTKWCFWNKTLTLLMLFVCFFLNRRPKGFKPHQSANRVKSHSCLWSAIAPPALQLTLQKVRATFPARNSIFCSLSLPWFDAPSSSFSGNKHGATPLNWGWGWERRNCHGTCSRLPPSPEEINQKKNVPFSISFSLLFHMMH